MGHAPSYGFVDVLEQACEDRGIALDRMTLAENEDPEPEKRLRRYDVCFARGRSAMEAIASGLVHQDRGRGLVNLDYDNDGDQDIVIFTFNGPLALFRNELAGPGTSWLRVFLDTSGVPGLAPNGFGARVIATTGGTTRTRLVHGGSSYLGVSELSAHFGLAEATVVDELRVEWPNGDVEEWRDPPIRRYITLHQGQGSKL